MISMVSARLIYLIAIFLTLSGCSPSVDMKSPKIRYGRDGCDECHMIISNASFAASLATRNQTYHKFDDIGCLLRFLGSRNDAAEIWVNDYTAEKPIKAHYAFYVKQNTQQTPMGYGILAFATNESAQKFGDGDVFSFDDLLKQFKESKGGLSS